MKFNFISIFTLLLISGCGDNVSFKPGPVLSEIIKERQKADVQLVQKAELCGEPASEDSSENSHAVVAVNPFEIRLDKIQEKDSVREAVAFEGKRFNFENAKRTLESRAQLLAASNISEEDLKKLILQPKLNEFAKPPIIIRVNCFNLEEGEILETEGRDLYIFADVVTINGTIRTTPTTREDYPGENGGDILIYAIKATFGPNALLDAKGGDAGAITSYPGDVFTDDPKDQQLKDKYVKEVRAALWTQGVPDKKVLRPVNADDTEEMGQLVEGYERNRKNMAVGSIGDAESVLFDIVEDEVNESGGTLERLTIDKIKSLRSSLETNEELSAEERKDALNRGSDVWLDIWKAAVLKSNTYDFNKRNNEMNWIVPGRLAVLIDDVVTKDQLKQTEGNKSVFYRKTVQYKDLNVGYGGRVRIYSAEGSPPSNKTEEPGRKSLSVAKPEWLYLVNGSPQLPDLGLVEYIERKIMFYARRTGDGSDKIGASAEEPYSMKKNITYEATEMPYQIKEITENPKLILHPHDRENILKDSLTPGPLFSAQNLLEATLRSGIQHQMPLYDELKKVKGK